MMGKSLFCRMSGVWVASSISLFLSGCLTGELATSNDPVATTSVLGGTGGALAAPNSASVFFSGHSLINVNTPTLFAQFAQNRGHGVNYQLQMGLGSTIRTRLQCPWNGQQADARNIQYRLQAIPFAG
jgi:hypothetical protein